jgi:hypothetical protein
VMLGQRYVPGRHGIVPSPGSAHGRITAVAVRSEPP